MFDVLFLCVCIASLLDQLCACLGRSSFVFVSVDLPSPIRLFGHAYFCSAPWLCVTPDLNKFGPCFFLGLLSYFWPFPSITLLVYTCVYLRMWWGIKFCVSQGRFATINNAWSVSLPTYLRPSAMMVKYNGCCSLHPYHRWFHFLTTTTIVPSWEHLTKKTGDEKNSLKRYEVGTYSSRHNPSASSLPHPNGPISLPRVPSVNQDYKTKKRIKAVHYFPQSSTILFDVGYWTYPGVYPSNNPPKEKTPVL